MLTEFVVRNGHLILSTYLRSIPDVFLLPFPIAAIVLLKYYVRFLRSKM